MDAFWSVIEWVALVASILYTVLAARQSNYCWHFGFMGAFLTLLLCIPAKLYSEILLQVSYMLLAVYGYWLWKYSAPIGKDSTQSFVVMRMQLKLHLIVLLIGVFALLFLGYLTDQLGAASPYFDSFTTCFSLLTTWLMAKRFLENWIYWIFVNSASYFLYQARGMEVLSYLFVLYVILSFYGFYKWYQLWRAQEKVLA